MSDVNGRFDRIERALEKIVEAQLQQAEVQVKQGAAFLSLTEAQVEQGEAFLRLTEVQVKQGEAFLRLTEAQEKQAEVHKRLELAQLETSEKLDALIKIADEWIRHRPQGGSNPT